MMKTTYQAGILAILALAAMAKDIEAQESLPGASPSATAQSQATDLQEIVVTAQKRSERQQDVPVTVVVLSAKQLEAAGVQSTTDLTKVVPGLIFAQDESSSQPAIRAVTSTITVPGSENPVAIYLDGIYQPLANGLLFDLPDVDHIEVLKGPQGTLFGRNATGGAIQISTRSPSYTTTGAITVSDGEYTGAPARSANEISTSGFLSGPIVADQLAYSIAASYRDNPGYMTNDVTGGRSGAEHSEGVRAKLLWQPSENTKFLLSSNYSQLYSAAAYNRAPLDGVSVGSTFPDAIVPNEPWHVAVDPTQPDFMRLKIYGVSLKADIRSSIGTFTSITGYLHAQNPNFVNSSGVYSPSCQAAFQCLSYTYATGSKSLTQEGDFVSDKFGMFSVTAGLFYYRNYGSIQDVNVLSGNSASVELFGYRDSVRTNSYAGFAELNADLTDHVHVILGGRYTKENLDATATLVPSLSTPVTTPVPIPSRSDDAFTPRVSTRYSFDSTTSTYFTYSKGFRSGSVAQAFDPPGSTGVNPETLNSYEVGIKTAQPLWDLNASYFRYNYTNLQLTKFVGALSYPQNAAAAKIDGVDFDASILMRPVRFKFGFEYLPRAEYENYQNAPLFSTPPGGYGLPISTPGGDASGQRMIRAPKFSGNLAANWEQNYSFGKLGVNVNVYYSSSFKWDVAGAIQTEAYEDVSTQFYYELNKLRFTLFGNNLLNKAAINGSQPSNTVFPVLYIPPREVGVAVHYSF